jgi:hypothetical protein
VTETRRGFFGKLFSLAAMAYLPPLPIVPAPVVFVRGVPVDRFIEGWIALEERIFFQALQGMDVALLPEIPAAKDGEPIYVVTPREDGKA